VRTAAFVRLVRKVCLVGAVTGLALPVLAADPKPEASVKNRNIEASVFLDDKIKADAALAADCLAEGMKWIDKNVAEAQLSRKQDPAMFRKGAWSFERKSALMNVTPASSGPII
jgi:hypothetical protein